jgi:hypothetical protein
MNELHNASAVTYCRPTPVLRNHNVTYIAVKQKLENEIEFGDHEELLLRIIDIFKFDVEDMVLIQETISAFLEEQNS